MDVEDLLSELQGMASEHNREGMSRFGIRVDDALGISVTDLRRIAKRVGRDHRLAADLWNSGIHEARILASLVEEPAKVTPTQAERWVRAFDSWDLCDQVCMNLFDRTSFAYEKAFEWSAREPEFVKRASFSLMAVLASHDKAADNAKLAGFFPVIEREARDERNFVKKAVNWALRGLGKRNAVLNALAVECAERIAEQDSRSARWIARDALRELNSEKVRSRLG